MKIQRKGGLIRLRPEKYEAYKGRSNTQNQGYADRPLAFRSLIQTGGVRSLKPKYKVLKAL